MASLETKVYRLRGIPAHLDRLGLARLIQPFLPAGKLEDISVASLALSCDFWSRHPTKTATLTLRNLPEVVREAPAAGEWELPVLALPKPLILDDTFFGLTPLNEVPESQHQHDCIVISGLASHPMGSWQPRGNNKSFMWIRDALPELFPGVRFILYGYDTKLVGSKSFQTVPDLANNLINELNAGGWSSPSSKQLSFLAHSLGGVVLKQCLFMLADSNTSGEEILLKIKGAIFFGVPSEGMNIEDIHSMLGDQPNKSALVAEISDRSDYLSSLEKRIYGISRIQGMKLFWAYETQTTPTVEMVSGTYRRSGPEAILVSRTSATGNRCTSDPASTIQIDANHSSMVKFSSGSHMIGPIANKLRDILGNHQEGFDRYPGRLATRNVPVPAATTTNTQAFKENSLKRPGDSTQNIDLWDIETIIQSIRAPERDERLQQVEDSAGCSFEWVFEDPSIGLSRWLQKGDGLYWVSGRPASGKSTFMKFLHKDGRTSQLLRGWYSRAEQVNANFFFHYRGNLIQKSFEGLLRSILSQVLEQAPGTYPIFQSLCEHHCQQAIDAESLGSLSSDINELLLTHGMEFGADFKLLPFLQCEALTKLFHNMVVEPLRESYGADTDWKEIEQLVVPRREQLQLFLRQGQLSEIDRFVNWRRWTKKMKDRFLSLLADWLVAIDLKEHLLRLDVLSAPDSAHSSTRTQAKASFAGHIENIMSRHRRRLDIRQSAQNKIWTRHNLEQAFFQIINQQSIDLDMCVFIDALDEYDGPSEFIADFLKEITQRRSSRTRLKILFSSRPWDKFTDAFSDCPGFRIHEHTENDVRELCLHVIRTQCPGSQELLQLVEEIVKQANGVFLWVKLVLQDLSRIAATFSPRDDTRSLSNKLQEELKNLPGDLADYYSAIIERIPQSFRREAFCLLEVVTKGDEVYLQDIPTILSCLNFSRFAERDQILGRILQSNVEELAVLLRTYTGGLIEAYGERHALKLRLLHQTTVDFVQLPGFKSLILDTGAHAMNDNGYTFLAKLELLRSKRPRDGALSLRRNFFIHARRSEKTTGKSLYSFFADTRVQFQLDLSTDFIPGAMCRAMRLETVKESFPAIGVALCAYLRLFIGEALQADPLIFFDTPACYVMPIYLTYTWEVLGLDEALQMTGTLATHGFPFENHTDDCLLPALCTLGKVPSRLKRSEPFVLDVTRRYKNPNVDLHLPPLWFEPPIIDIDIPSETRVNIIYVSSYHIIKDLLERKADPNVQAFQGYTPLDCWVLDALKPPSQRHDAHRVMTLLVQNGGLLNMCTTKQWRVKMGEFHEQGLSVSLFEALGYPKWVKKGKFGLRQFMRNKVVGLFESQTN
ncbi:hypothetical protein BBK36DRAFT_1126010 [Trichoderma citrinoviride]|uniref:Nephrocystin 3-like N-terminal domain-containing protein n=1 Tax=Trichoderma citrinoviride TaxID=58853 RepID=A0A2T4B3F5_9HYPO|nr:hypothetical protein BBK36DRAFT_1126010 [Trichoderma citrinoviride]PTB63731.1 hypothetical protein BBK36DRAFT_1126010 [Trichoderma citrinoviride]